MVNGKEWLANQMSDGSFGQIKTCSDNAWNTAQKNLTNVGHRPFLKFAFLL